MLGIATDIVASLRHLVCGFAERLLAKRNLLVIAVPNKLHHWSRPVKSVLGALRAGRFRNLGKFGVPKLALDEPGVELHSSYFTCSVLKALLERQGFICARWVLSSSTSRWVSAQQCTR